VRPPSARISRTNSTHRAIQRRCSSTGGPPNLNATPVREKENASRSDSDRTRANRGDCRRARRGPAAATTRCHDVISATQPACADGIHALRGTPSRPSVDEDSPIHGPSWLSDNNPPFVARGRSFARPDTHANSPGGRKQAGTRTDPLPHAHLSAVVEIEVRQEPWIQLPPCSMDANFAVLTNSQPNGLLEFRQDGPALSPRSRPSSPPAVQSSFPPLPSAISSSLSQS